jgi:uroporphyrinogen-III synthase
MRVLITRPREDALRIAEKIRAMGHEPVIAPLLELRFHDGEEISLDGIQAVLATSANGVRALARRTARRDVPVFAVGPQTAEEARALGFVQVKNANGDSKALAAATRGWARPDGGALLHVKGAEADGTLAGLLRDFDLRGVVLYEMAPVARLETVEADAALFFSPRSARVFVESGIDARRWVAICISDATAAALAPLQFREIRVAAAPNQAALLEKLL